MTLSEFNLYCSGLPQSTHVVQWGGSDVWKVGGKLFAIARVEEKELQVTFKVSDIAFEFLQSQSGLRPAPYLASRGMKWIQHYAAPGLSPDDLKYHIQKSYTLAIERLTQKLRLELGL